VIFDAFADRCYGEVEDVFLASELAEDVDGAEYFHTFFV
jgi:hypothetical protein